MLFQNALPRRQTHCKPFAFVLKQPAVTLNCFLRLLNHDTLLTWFEPGKECVVIQEPEEAVERYRWLLQHERERLAMGLAARERVLKEHTYRHRARELIEIVQTYL